MQSRTRYIAQCRSLLSAHGYMIRDGGAESFADRVHERGVPAPLLAPVEPLLRLIGGLNAELEQIDRLLKEQLQRDERARAMATMPSVGPITALTLLSVLDEAGRFESGRQVASYLGLVPRENSSRETQRRGRITKAGAPIARSLLLQAAHSMIRLKNDATREMG